MKPDKNTAHWLRRGLASVALFVFALGITPRADAIILFQNDNFFDMESPNLMIDSTDRSSTTRAIQFGNTTSTGSIIWNVADTRFEFSDEVFITNGLTASGSMMNFSNAGGFRLRESSNPDGLAACTVTDEVIFNTTMNRLEYCVTPGVSGAADWEPAAAGSASAIASYASAPLTCTEGEVYYNTTSNQLFMCTATNTWNDVGPDDFETIFQNDGDGVLTTSNQNFSVNTGTANFNVDGAALSLDGTTSSNFTVTGNSAGNVGLTLNATNAGAGQGNVSISAEDNVSISSSTWNITGAGVASGLTGITSTGTINFSGSSQTRIRETATVTNGSTACTNAGELIIETSTNSMYICTNAGTDTWKKAAGNKLANMEFAPEFPDAVVYRDGSNNIGTLVGDFDAGADQHYYGWTTTNGSLNDISVKTRLTLPNDFTAIGDLVTNYRTGTATAADNKLIITVKNITDTQTCFTTGDLTNAGWTTTTVTAANLGSGCTGFGAGDVLEIEYKLHDKNGGTTYTRVGSFNLGYTN